MVFFMDNVMFKSGISSIIMGVLKKGIFMVIIASLWMNNPRKLI